jgi:hypothetical protein
VTTRRAAFALGALVAAYLVLVGWRGVLLIRGGSPTSVVLGLAVLTLPAIGAWAVWREIWFGLESQAMARELEAEGGLPLDDLPRRPSGRPEPVAADAAFEQRRAEAEAAPEDWRSWFRLALSYDDAGDRRRARQAMRRAIDRYRPARRSDDRPSP